LGSNDHPIKTNTNTNWSPFNILTGRPKPRGKRYVGRPRKRYDHFQ